MKTVHNFVKSERELFSSSVRSFLPQDALVPFCPSEFRAVVSEGTPVSEGQVIAVPSGGGDSPGADIHASVPGTVTGIVPCALPDGTEGLAVRIHLEGSFSYLGKTQEHTQWGTFSPDYLLSIFSQKGIVNTFYRPVPLAGEIRSCASAKDRFLVVRMFDEDPSRMTDSFVASRLTEAVAEGAAIAARAMSAEGVIFALPQKPQFSLDGCASVLGGLPYCSVLCDTTRYPAGFSQNIIQQVRRSAQEPFCRVSHRSLFIDPETAVSVYDAVVLGIPVVERYVHVTGKNLPSAALLKVRIGTTIGALSKQCGGLLQKEPHAIINGLVSGFAEDRMDMPVGKHVKSVEFVAQSPRREQKFAPCIHCGSCRAICPERIYPDLMYRYRICRTEDDAAIARTAVLCSDCGLCNSRCPSRLPLSQTIALLRRNQQ